MNSADLELVHAVKHYGDTTAVDRIDLKILAGRYCCLLGPSGCGKTSTLRMIAGHERVDEGDILLGTRNITHLPTAQRGTAMMFQSYALFPHLDALDNVAFSLKMRGVAKAERQARARELLDRVSLGALAHRRPAELSGGQQQRVAVARALASKPQIVFADEPTGNVDSRAGAEILTFMSEVVRDHGQTIVMVTHDPSAAAYAGRVVFLADGKIVDELLNPTADSVLDRMRTLGG
jgi:putative spermidine/putrescine transport system ATP-binding protein